jgi:hypothetical protein
MSGELSADASRPPVPSEATYSPAELDEIDREISAAVEQLRVVGKSPEDAVAIFEACGKIIDDGHGSISDLGWTAKQIWPAFELLCLVGLREALRNPSSASPEVMVTAARWLRLAGQKNDHRKFSRDGGRAPKLQQDILDACIYLRAQSRMTAKHAYQLLIDGCEMPVGRVVRLQDRITFTTFQTRYWTKAKVLT